LKSVSVSESIQLRWPQAALPGSKDKSESKVALGDLGSRVTSGAKWATVATEQRANACGWRGMCPLTGESEGRVDWSFFDVVWSIFIFFFWVMFFWMFISVFSDIFRRDDLSGWGKAAWIFLIFVLPFLGILIYMIARPKMTDQDRRMIVEAEAKQQRMAGYSAADEIAKLGKLRDEGKISAEEYERLKQKAIA